LYNYYTAVHVFGKVTADEMRGFLDNMVYEHSICLDNIDIIKQKRKEGTYVYSEVDYLILEECKANELSFEIKHFWEKAFLQR
jgi:hypothetical protein